MSTKHILILVGLTLSVFSCTLFNRFVGDDHVLFEGNAFYTSWSHWPDLFTRRYLTPGTIGGGAPGPVYNSGSVSYRPVLSLSYFFDYSLWKLDPFGYHLTNLVLHLFNTLLVYALLVAVCRNPTAALLGACIFGLHPTKVEAVAAIGYRADLLACFFQLLSFLSFIYYRTRHKARYWTGCLAAYFLALFTKESAVVMPLIFLAYDFYFSSSSGPVHIPCSFVWRKPPLNREAIGQISLRAQGMPLPWPPDEKRGLILEYMLLMALTVFYLYIYFFVFPNTSLTHIQYLGGTLARQVTAVSWIFTRYMIDMILPFQVTMLPPLYLPAIEPFPFLRLLSGILLFAAAVAMTIRFYKTDKPASFFMGLFLVSLIPVANIIPLANPMAHRFLYFPSIGFAAVCAIFLARWQGFSGGIFKTALIGLCVAYTLPLNVRWNNDVSVAKTLLEHYPDNIKAHLILGWQYLKAGDKKQARQQFAACIRLGDRDPWIADLMKAAHE
ncbi:MAG: hypothetical protein KGJ95_01855 [Candidatus Omnitrophica bacterium]|nr:hypothetical protein [Candidatus Omnitrophota bacterium]